MRVGTTGEPPILFHHLIDDAALFPPGNAPMDGAVPAHLALRAGPLAGLVGPFLCPASRVPELVALLPADGFLEIGLIVDTGLDSVADVLVASRADARIRAVMVEAPVPAGSDLPAGAARAIEQVERAAPEARLYVELPRTAGWTEALDVLADAGRAAKFRTGGLAADALPE